MFYINVAFNNECNLKNIDYEKDIDIIAYVATYDKCTNKVIS